MIWGYSPQTLATFEKVDETFLTYFFEKVFSEKVWKNRFFSKKGFSTFFLTPLLLLHPHGQEHEEVFFAVVFFDGFDVDAG